MKKQSYILLFMFSLVLGLYSQYDDTPPKQVKSLQESLNGNNDQTIEKYRWPLEINNGFSSGFQEYRSNHFHAGFDLRTFQKVGYPVYAIADGYIVKIRMVKRGSGRGLYLKHDDGNTSIYFHLDRFEDKLENVLKQLQRNAKKKYIDNYFLKKPIRYKKGELIGYAGETGSGFPHLHLEIRDKDYFALNPFPLIKFPGEDRHFPVLKKLLIRNRGQASINGSIGENIFSFQMKSGDYYTLTKPLIISGDVDMVLGAYDVSDTGRHVAPHSVTVSIDENRYFQIYFDRFERDDNNQLGFVYDLFYSNSSNYFFNLFTQKGYELEQQKIPFGQIMSSLDYGKHTLRIQVNDNDGNVSTGVVPIYKVPVPLLKLSDIKKNDAEKELHLEILKLKSIAPPEGEIKIDVFDRGTRRISTGRLHYSQLTEPKPLVLTDFSKDAAYIEFIFYMHGIAYHKQRYMIEDSHLSGLTHVDFDTFLNRDDVFIVIKDKAIGADNISLTVIQGDDSQVVEPKFSSDNIYFQFKPLNRLHRVLLRFSLKRGGDPVAEIQENLELIYLREGEKRGYSYQEFEAFFDTRSVYEPKVLKVEEKDYSSDYPVLSRQISLSPCHFPFLDTVYYKFKKKLPNPQQVAIFQYNPISGRWGARYTEYDSATHTYKIRVISSGVFALMRDTIAPKVWFSRPKVSFKKSVRRLIFKITDKGKGVNDNSIKIWLNGQRICTSYDCECEYDPDRSTLVIEELGNLKIGDNLIKIHVTDYAGNVTDRIYRFALK